MRGGAAGVYRVAMKALLLGAALATATSLSAAAQYTDEIVVTATRMSEVPGQVLVVPGDNLLLAVRVESDDRDAATRYREITDTINAMLAAASEDDDISISFVDDDLVRPLTPSLFQEAIGRGSRPDTSQALLRVRTPIPDAVPDAFALATRLQRFVDGIAEEGRVTVEALDDVTVSVVDPSQYRPRLLGLITGEIREVTEALGPDYRAVLDGIDGEMKSYRAGDLSLAFYLPYEYRVIPATLTTINVLPEDY